MNSLVPSIGLKYADATRANWACLKLVLLNEHHYPLTRNNRLNSKYLRQRQPYILYKSLPENIFHSSFHAKWSDKQHAGVCKIQVFSLLTLLSNCADEAIIHSHCTRIIFYRKIADSGRKSSNWNVLKSFTQHQSTVPVRKASQLTDHPVFVFFFLAIGMKLHAME